MSAMVMHHQSENWVLQDNEKYSHGPWRVELPLTDRDKSVVDECNVESILIKKHTNRSLRHKSHITPSVSTAQIQASAFGAKEHSSNHKFQC